MASKTPAEVSISSRSDEPSEDRTDEGSELEYMGGGTALGKREGGKMEGIPQTADGRRGG